jgi:ribosomal protein S18 acetylase RimI-like enzyme
MSDDRVAIVDALEEALVRQWHHFGSGPGATWLEDDDVIMIDAPVPQLPYNGVLRTSIHDVDHADERISSIVAHYREREVPFLWIVHPTASPADLGERLQAAGIGRVEVASGMAIELAGWTAPAGEPADGTRIEQVADLAMMEDFESLSADYWHLLPQSKRFVAAVNRAAGFGPDAAGRRWIAYVDDEPAGKVYLSFRGHPDTCAFFGVSVPERFRGRGLASSLMVTAIEEARRAGYARAVLHSSEMAVGLYRRLGFADVAPFAVHATAGLHAVS